MSAPGAASPPSLPELHAPAAWQSIDFLSDLHLCDATPRTFEALATHLRCTEADAVFILGDLFEVWVGDDARHEGFEAECAAMLAEASAHRFIGFMAGNRDFLVGDEMLRHCGIVRLADPTVLVAFDQRLVLTHGDALCVGDVDYQAFRAQVRTDAWQADFLAKPLAQRRRIAADIRAESRRRHQSREGSPWFDVDEPAARRWMAEARAATMIHGHTHVPARHPMDPDLVRFVLSDWDHDHRPDTPRSDVLRWRHGAFLRIAPATVT